jgi:hypothetical protein
VVAGQVFNCQNADIRGVNAVHISLGSMDATFLFAVLGHSIGVPLLVVGLVLSIPAGSRWFAGPVIFFAVLGASIATATGLPPYTWSAVFWAAFTLIALFLGSASAATAVIICIAEAVDRRHAA